MLDYLWLVIAGGITSFTKFAMGIGANDVAACLCVINRFPSINCKIGGSYCLHF